MEAHRLAAYMDRIAAVVVRVNYAHDPLRQVLPPLPLMLMRLLLLLLLLLLRLLQLPSPVRHRDVPRSALQRMAKAGLPWDDALLTDLRWAAQHAAAALMQQAMDSVDNKAK